MKQKISFARARALEDEGQTMAEYALILSGIFVVVAVSVFAIGPALIGLFEIVVAAF